MKIKFLLSFLISTCLSTNLSVGVLAASYKIIYQENFEDGHDGWTFYQTAQTAGDWQIHTDPTHGNNLGVNITGAFRRSWAVYDTTYKDFEYSVDVLGIAGEDKNIGFRINNAAQYEMYGVHFRGPASNDISLEKFNASGVGVNLVTANHNFVNGTWYNIKIIARGDNFRIYVNGVEVINYTDNQNVLGAPYLEGKIGLVATTGAVAPTTLRFDNITVRDLDKLDVPHFLQDDPDWGSDLYSRAFNTAGERMTIASHGCYMTSAAMMLNYHGLTDIEDPQTNTLVPLTPKTLNAWLMNRPDGYRLGGDTNQLAILDWTDQRHKMASQDLSLPQTPQFEYFKSDFSAAATASQLADEELSAGNPTMLKVSYRYDNGTESTHFLVTSGKTEDDYYILDPLNIDTSLDNNRYNNKIYGTRIFKPAPPAATPVQGLGLMSLSSLQSQILDRSAMLISTLEDNPFLITDSLGRRLGSDPVTGAIYHEIPDSSYSLEEPVANLYGPPAYASYLAEIMTPNDGSYQIQVFNSSDQAPVEIFSYGRTGEFQVTRENLPTGTEAINEFTYNHESGNLDLEPQPTPTPSPTISPTPTSTPTPTPTVNPQTAFASLIKSIQTGVKNKEIKSPLLGAALALEVKAAQIINLSKYSPKTVAALKIIRQQILAATPKHITSNYSDNLVNQIDQIIDSISSN